jgi:hypothetical protein
MLIRAFNFSGFLKIFIVLLPCVITSMILFQIIIKSSNELKIKTLSKVQSNVEFVSLENILTSKVQPENGNNVFFLDTIRMKKNDKERPFTAREACAIEVS